MVEVYVLMSVTAEAVRRVAAEARAMRGVLEADTVTGPYDLIARVAGRSIHEVEAAVSALSAIEGVGRLLKCPVARPLALLEA